jgi:spermidine synthase
MMKEFIYPEMMVHVPMCTHKQPKNVLIVSDDAAPLEAELGRHPEVTWTAVPATNALGQLRDVADASADIVLLEASADAAVIAHCNRILNVEGLMVLKHPSLDDEAANRALMEILGNYFKIIMPYNVGNGETLLLASKAYHPTADVILQRSDLIEGQRYYNSDIHEAAFAMPNYIRKAYLGIIRN